MSKEIAEKPKEETKAISKPYTADDLRKMAKGFTVACDPEQIYHSVAKELSAIPEGKKKSEEVEKALLKRADELMLSEGVGTLYPITETVGERFRPLVRSTAKQFIAEYKCETPSEKALAEVAAGAYVRIIEYSRALHSSLNIEFLSSEKNGYYSFIGKEVDRAERHFQSAIATLKHIKTPPLSVKVTTQTAFIAQNQQLNAITKPNEQNNEPK